MPNKAALAQVRQIARLQALLVAAGRKAWGRVDPDRISESWSEQIDRLDPVVAAVQVRAASAAAAYGAAALAEQKDWVAPEAFVNAAAFAGWFADPSGLVAVPTKTLLYSPAVKAKELIRSGRTVTEALQGAGFTLDRLLASGVADTGRQAAGVDIASRPGVGYIRQLVGSSCKDCVILAGRWYRWNAGFDRHPHDDCIHVPAKESSADGLVTDPYEHFKSLSEAEQDRLWGKGGAQAIRDGADISRVTNSSRGKIKMSTLEGMGRRGFARPLLKARQKRLTPEAIYKLHPNRADALRELERHGYIHAGGQNPLGSVKGAFYEGFGQMGRGGTRRAASDAVRLARETGMRVADRYTMTAAERRFYDAANEWAVVLRGQNPYVPPAFSTTPDPYGVRLGFGAGPARKLDPEVAARVERNYRLALEQAIRDAVSARRHG